MHDPKHNSSPYLAFRSLHGHNECVFIFLFAFNILVCSSSLSPTNSTTLFRVTCQPLYKTTQSRGYYTISPTSTEWRTHFPRPENHKAPTIRFKTSSRLFNHNLTNKFHKQSNNSQSSRSKLTILVNI